jgi:recombinational DNA repair protein (RecF pathway)
MEQHCARCQKKLSRKRARLIDGKVLCSTCMFAPPPRNEPILVADQTPIAAQVQISKTPRTRIANPTTDK